MSVFSGSYLEDGNLIVNKTQLIDVVKVLQSNKATEKSLFLNLSKCFIYSPKLPVWASSVKYFDPETEMEKTVPSGNSGTVVLGTPIGSQEFNDDFILQEILIPRKAACHTLNSSCLEIAQPSAKLLSFFELSLLLRGIF